MLIIHEPDVRSVLLDDSNLQALLVRLAALKRKTISLDEVWSAFASVYSDLPAGRERRLWLRTILDELDGSGEITLPVKHGTLWDRTSDIALPTRIALSISKPSTASLDWRVFPWHPQLQWVLERRFISPSHVSFLIRVHEGLVAGWFKNFEPMKYRSLQLTGDEKRLQKFAKTKLFDAGKLSFEFLGCDAYVLPIATERISGVPVMLMFENAAPFMVARSIARETTSAAIAHAFGTLAYGGGKQVLKSVGYLTTFKPAIETILYVGDLDAEGLQLAADLKRLSQSIPVVPATQFHQAMLESAVELNAPDGWPAKEGQPRSVVPSTLLFLESTIRSHCEGVVQSGRRIPEEVLSTKWMRPLLRKP